MGLDVRVASGAEIDEVLGWTHALWGDDVELAAYRDRTHRLLATAWGQARYRFYVGRDEAGALVCACKRYLFDLGVAGRPEQAIGFGAVFTAEHARGRGHAARLIEALNARAAAEGVGLALLYSDIGPDYYARLGFAPLGGLAGECLSHPGPDPFLPLEEAHEPLLPGWWRAMAEHPACRPFHYARDPVYWAYLARRNPSQRFVYAPDGVPRGYLVARVEPGELLVEEAAYEPGLDEAAFWAGVRAFAAARCGAESLLTGWFPPGAAGVTLSAIADGLPMAKRLDDRPLPQAQALWGYDHF